MSKSRRDLTRLVALGSAAGMIGVPIALIASTWQPLESASSSRQSDDADEEIRLENDRKRRRRGTEGTPQTRDPTNRSRGRERAPGASPARDATPAS
jgi:hypothetical protein